MTFMAGQRTAASPPSQAGRTADAGNAWAAARSSPLQAARDSDIPCLMGTLHCTASRRWMAQPNGSPLRALALQNESNSPAGKGFGRQGDAMLKLPPADRHRVGRAHPRRRLRAAAAFGRNISCRSLEGLSNPDAPGLACRPGGHAVFTTGSTCCNACRRPVPAPMKSCRYRPGLAQDFRSSPLQVRDARSEAPRAPRFPGAEGTTTTRVVQQPVKGHQRQVVTGPGCHS